MTPARPRQALAALVACGALFAAGPPGHAAEAPSHAFYVENDVLSGTDRYYTNGLRYQRSRDEVERAPRWAGPALRRFELCTEPNASRDCYSLRRGFAVTQLMYTPEDITRPELIIEDRPYGGWLRYESLLDLYNERELHQLQLSVGVVGSASLAGPVQRGFHRIIDAARPEGWEHQVGNEPTLLLLYRWSQAVEALEGWDADQTIRWFSLTPHAVATLGNVFTYGGAGLTARLGYNITDPLATSIQAVAARAEDRGDWEAYVFVGVEGRALARNLFLDGSTFRSSHSVDKEHFVHDLEAGVHARWRRLAVTYRTISRSREFRGQRSGQSWGSLTFTVLGSF